MSTAALRPDRGSTMAEVVVAILILAIGILALAGTTALSMRQVALSDFAADRAIALQATVERLRALDYGALDSGSETVGAFAMTWTVVDAGDSKLLEIVSVGPGRTGAPGSLAAAAGAADTLAYRIVGP